MNITKAFFITAVFICNSIYSVKSYFINRIPKTKVDVIVAEKLEKSSNWMEDAFRKVRGTAEGSHSTRINLRSPKDEYSSSKVEWIEAGDLFKRVEKVEGVAVEVEGYKSIQFKEAHLDQINKNPGLYVVIAKDNDNPVIYMSQRNKTTEKYFESCRDIGNQSKDYGFKACQLAQDKPEYIFEKL